jgi:hypothetical protein
MTQSSNPLKQFFRQPAIYLRLPSQGKLWDADSLDMPENQELPVYPMTAIDEITYRTPDALFNGQAVVDVIQSCVPNIKNAWKTPSVDFNSILVAIRIASYGHTMDITVTCPKCQNQDDFGLDLRTVLDQMKTPDYGTPLKHRDLTIFFCSMDYKQQNASNIEQFENQRLINLIPESDLSDEEKLIRMSEVMKNLTRLTVKALTSSIKSISTVDTVVTEPEFIEEFLNNCDREIFNRIRDHAVELRQSAELSPVNVECTQCHHGYEQQLNLDLSGFFERAS